MIRSCPATTSRRSSWSPQQSPHRRRSGPWWRCLGYDESMGRGRKANDLPAGCTIPAVVVVVAFLVYAKCTWDGWSKEYDNRRREQERAALADQQHAFEEERLALERKAKAKAAAEAAEAARTPEERASTAIGQLNASGSVIDAVCAARKTLEPVSKESRKLAPVAKAFTLLRTKEGQALRAAIQEATESRSVVCADGSGSSCRCLGSHRGCCSHHGGIVGCEPLPKEITCSQ